MKRVVVTGLGAVTPLGNTVKEFWDNIVAGKSGVAAITKFDTSKFKTNFAAEVKDFDAELYVDKKELTCIHNMPLLRVIRPSKIPALIFKPCRRKNAMK